MAKKGAVKKNKKPGVLGFSVEHVEKWAHSAAGRRFVKKLREEDEKMRNEPLTMGPEFSGCCCPCHDIISAAT